MLNEITMLTLVPREASKTPGAKLKIIFDSSLYHSKQLVFKYTFFIIQPHIIQIFFSRILYLKEHTY